MSRAAALRRGARSRSQTTCCGRSSQQADRDAARASTPVEIIDADAEPPRRRRRRRRLRAAPTLTDAGRRRPTPPAARRPSRAGRSADRAMASTSRRSRRQPFRTLPADRGRAPRDRRGGHPLQGPDRRAARPLRPGGTASPASSPRSRCPSAPVDWCRGAARRRQGAGARRQFRQRQRLHRQEAAARRSKLTAGIAADGASAAGRRGVPRLDRRDRRAARRRRKFAGVAGGLRASARPTAAGSTPPRAIMTTDTFPKVATRTAEIGGVDGRRSTASPRAPA